tara:strand:+ start:146 stop:1309 length:1164 start_codon:yes stop_codon:yes gene_type:complete
MDKRKLDKVVRDVKKILILAKSAHGHLESGKIRKAKRELKRVMSYDADEITRLNDEGDDERTRIILSECGVVLKDAKKALRDLDSNELFDDAKQLIDEIVALEGHELMELEEEERMENMAFERWYGEIKSNYLYHGSTKIIIEKLQTYGLSPLIRPWDKADQKRINALYKKGAGTYFGSDYEEEVVQTACLSKDAVHLTNVRGMAVGYAKKGAPAYWSEVCAGWSKRLTKSINQAFKDAEKHFLFSLCQTFVESENSDRISKLTLADQQRLIWNPIQEQFARSYQRGAKRSIDFVEGHSFLKREEIKEARRIFRKLWFLFRNNDTPILIKISPTAPAVRSVIGESLGSFTGYKKYLKSLSKSEKAFHPNDIKVTQRISSKYIEVEEV